MEISIKHIGHSPIKASNVLELTVTGDNSILTEKITDLHGNVDEELITSFRSIADQLEEQNKLVDLN
jgi:hypothetical protein